MISEPSYVNSSVHNCRILLVGIGGIGSEILRCLILSGFRNIDIVDNDTVEISNLTRQIFYKSGDEGKPKVDVMTKNASDHFRSMKDLNIRPFYCDIELFFEKFDINPTDYNFILSGLDNVESRRILNTKIFIEKNKEKNLFLIDSGTEGFNGHCRVIIPNITSCYECTLGLNTQEVNYPLCEIKEFPRTPLHCIAYASFIYEEKEWNMTEENNHEKILRIHEIASNHARSFGIQGVTIELTEKIVGSIIPTLMSTNTIISSTVVSIVRNFVLNTSENEDFQKINNYFLYYGQTGIYSSSIIILKDNDCIFCNKIFNQE